MSCFITKRSFCCATPGQHQLFEPLFHLGFIHGTGKAQYRRNNNKIKFTLWGRAYPTLLPSCDATHNPCHKCAKLHARSCRGFLLLCTSSCPPSRLGTYCSCWTRQTALPVHSPWAAVGCVTTLPSHLTAQANEGNQSCCLGLDIRLCQHCPVLSCTKSLATPVAQWTAWA